MEAQQ